MSREQEQGERSAAARDVLAQLADRARERGLDDLLATPLAAMLGELGLRGPARRFVRDLATTSCRSLGDLFALDVRQVVRAIGVSGLSDLVHRCDELLEDEADDRAAAPAPRLAPTAARPGTPTDRARPSLAVPDGAAIEAWARERGVAPALEIVAVTVPGLFDQRILERLYRSHHRLTVREFVTGSPLVASLLGPPEVARADAACRGLLDRVAERVAAEAREEAEFLERLSPIESPVLAAVATGLRTARAAARAHTGPRSSLRQPPPAGTFTDDPPCYTVAAHAASPYGSGHAYGHVTIELLAWRDAPPAVRCTCRPGQPAGCAHALAAIDSLLTSVHRPGGVEAARIAAALALAPWQRLIGALDRQLAPARAPVSEQRLSWRLDWGGDSVALRAYLQKPLKRGGWSSGTRVGLNSLARCAAEHGDERDRRAAALLFPPGTAAWTPAPDRATVARALAALIDHPRVHLDDDPARTISIRSAHLGIALTRDDAGHHRIGLTLDGAPLADDRLGRALERDATIVLLDPEPPTCRLIAVDSAIRGVALACRAYGGALPVEAVEALLERLPALEQLVPIALPAELEGERIEASSQVVLRLTPREPGLELAAVVRPLAGGAGWAPGQGPRRVTGSPGGRRVVAERDLGVEIARAADALDGLPGLPARPGHEGAGEAAWRFAVADDDVALDLVLALQDRAGDALAIEWPEQALTVRPATSAAQLRVAIRDRGDWFGLEGGVEVDGERVELAALLDAVRRGRRYVRVGAAAWLAITAELRERLGAVADQVHVGRRGLEIGPTAAAAIEDLASDGATLSASRTWRALAGRLRSARALEPAPPAALTATLRDYQVDGFRWLSRLAAWGVGACLADDMGLGKTLQALAVLVDRAGRGPALVVAPTSVGFNWLRECQRFAPTLAPILYREQGREGRLADLGPGDLVIASYGVVTRDAAALAGVRFATLVIDEAQAIKNAATRRARAVRDLDCEWRMALTGTPIENHLGELWSLFRAISPGLLGSWEQFRERFANPIEQRGDAERLAGLARTVRPFILRRTKAEVVPELPPRTDVQLTVELSPAERRVYDDARLAILAQLAGGGAARAGAARGAPDQRFEILAALTRLRQLACHPGLADPTSEVPSAKLKHLLRIVGDLRANRHRALVFSQFTRHLALVRTALDQAGVPYLYLDGQTPAREREHRVDAFQRGDGDLFLISLKAGGTGLNLTAADYVIHLDPWWNPAVEDQASDRAHRLGQTRPVTTYRLVARDTIEEAILALHERKRDLVAGVLDQADTAGALSTAELIELIRGGAPTA